MRVAFFALFALFAASGASAQAPPPPPLSLQLTWTESTATSAISSTTWTLWGNQLTKTEHVSLTDGSKDIVTTGDVDSTALQNLIPPFPKEKELKLPPSSTKKTVSASLLVNGSLLVISGPLPEKPTGELAALLALRDAIETSAKERAPSTPTPPKTPPTPKTKPTLPTKPLTPLKAPDPPPVG